eukprot:scaffold8387_cov46-Attheya_sp.AAC.3
MESSSIRHPIVRAHIITCRISIDVSSSRCDQTRDEMTSVTPPVPRIINDADYHNTLPYRMTTAAPPSLLTCSPSELALYLHRQRFDSNDMATATFLLSCTSELPNADSISQQLMGTNNNNDTDEQETKAVDGGGETTNDELGSIVVDHVPVSALTPRGKQELTLYTSGLTLTHPKTGDSVQVPCHSVQHVVAFPKPETCRRFTTTSSSKSKHEQSQPNDMILMVFHPDSDIRYKQKVLSQICFSIPIPNNTTDTDTTGASWLNQLAQSLQWKDNDDPSKSIIQVGSLQNKFVSDSGGGDQQTSTTTAGMPFVKCYKGVHDGALFPLQEGLLFFKYVSNPSGFLDVCFLVDITTL